MQRSRARGARYAVISGALMLAAFGANAAQKPVESTPPSDPPAEGCTAARRIDELDAEYPAALRKLGSAGSITVQFKLASNNSIEGLIVERSLHPIIERLVLPYLFTWKFEASRCKNIGTASSIRQQIDFAPGEEPLRNPFSIKPENLDKLPPELRFDEPPAVKIAVAPVFPIDMLWGSKAGSAIVTALVNPAGRVQESIIVQADQPQFGLAARAMMQSWIFEPAKKDGQPSWALISYQQFFAEDARDTFITPEQGQILGMLAEGDPAILAFAELDEPPKPLYRPGPLYPPLLNEAGIGDTVKVQFVIDQEGRVQFPTPVRYRNEELAWIAATTVGRWLFMPPKAGGEIVNARGEATLTFKPK